MAARTGQEFLDGLRATRRALWIDGARVDDPTTHPATRGAAATVASIFDRQHTYADECLVADPDTGESMNVSHLIPRSADDVARRMVGLTRISEGTVGLMGRTPDYMNMKFSAFASRPSVWAGKDGSAAAHAENLVTFQRELRRRDLSLTHTIIQPTVDKRTDPDIVGNTVTIRKVGETADGIVVRGGRVLATLAPFADELAVYPALPLPRGADDYAVSFAIPLDTPGLRFLCRDSASAPDADPFDRPLSARFDEQDGFAVFDDVVVPWHRIFIDGDVGVYNGVHATGYLVNMTTQATIRGLTKLEFAYGLGTRMAEMIGDHSPTTADMLGEIACYVQTTRNAVELSTARAWERDDGVWLPDGNVLEPMRALLATWFPRVQEILTLIGSHDLLATPSRSQLDDEELRPLIDELLHGADGTSAEDRAALFRLAWDFIGSSLAGRGFLYERFYLTSATRNRQALHLRSFDRTRANRLVDDMLDLARR